VHDLANKAKRYFTARATYGKGFRRVGPSKEATRHRSSVGAPITPKNKYTWECATRSRSNVTEDPTHKKGTNRGGMDHSRACLQNSNSESHAWEDPHQTGRAAKTHQGKSWIHSPNEEGEGRTSECESQRARVNSRQNVRMGCRGIRKHRPPQPPKTNTKEKEEKKLFRKIASQRAPGI